MSNFRCSAGHLVALSFAEKQLRVPCPDCGVDIYKFRDVVHGDEDTAQSVVAPEGGAKSKTYRLNTKQTRIAIGGGVILLAAALFLSRSANNTSPAQPVSPGAVIPVGSVASAAASRPAPPVRVNGAATPAAHPSKGADVAIAHLSAVPTEAGAIKVTFNLENRGDPQSDYPALAIHWHGAPEADQVVGKDAYAHPPLPFSTTGVTLELARPQAATGIDVTLAY